MNRQILMTISVLTVLMMVFKGGSLVGCGLPDVTPIAPGRTESSPSWAMPV